MHQLLKHIVFTAGLVAIFAAAPLTDSQRTRLETADDGSATVDDAAFYALLENAAEWDGDQTAGATIPDYEQVRENPSEWRGKLCLIEGTLEMQMPEREWARSGWDQVRGVVVRVETGEPVVVYLTNPPELHRSWINEKVLRQRGSEVRVVARFYKLLKRESRGGENKVYPVFVGRELMGFRAADNSWNVVTSLLIVIVLLAIVFGWLWRANMRRQRYGAEARQRRIQEQLGQRRGERETDAEEDEDEEPLPEDPVAALGELSQRHEEDERTDEPDR